MKVSVVFATCGRNDLFRDALISCLNTSRPNEIEIVAVIDNESQNVNVIHNYAWADKFIIDYSPNRRGALWAWNRALQISTGDILVPAGDDQIFHPNWLDYALESHQNKLNGYGVVGMNDLAYDGNTQVATMWLFDRAYCKKEMGGIFAPPMYHYYCVDSEWNEKAKMLGRFYWDERSKVEHIHSAHGKRPVDEIDEYKVDEWMSIDAQTYANRREQGFPVTWQPLI